MINFAINEQKKGIEIYFQSMPSAETRNSLKAAGWRWSSFNKCWYNKHTSTSLEFAQALCGSEVFAPTTKEPKPQAEKISVKIYVSTYHKYNSGSLAGAWLNLPMKDNNKLKAALRKIAGSEWSPEFMIQDYEVDFDFRSISECEDILALNKELLELSQNAELEKTSNKFEGNKAFDRIKKYYAGVWEKDLDMLNYCLKEVEDCAELSNGSIFLFEKMDIQKSFCHCADYNGIYCAETEKAANDACRYDYTKEGFFYNNLKEINENIETLKNNEEVIVYNSFYQSYCSEKRKETIFKRFTTEKCHYWEEYGKGECFILTDADKKKIVDVLESAKERFIKRLESWWKRYGAQGLHVWTYYSD